MARQQLIYEHLERGNTELQKGQQVEALADFLNALQLDPDNQFAQQRLRDALGEWTPGTSESLQGGRRPGACCARPGASRSLPRRFPGTAYPGSGHLWH